MRKITEQSRNAFYNKECFKSGNTEVFYSKTQDASYMSLHGNTIATLYGSSLQLSTCGWSTNTTKERLNSLDGVNIVQRNFVWFLNGVEWDGGLININL